MQDLNNNFIINENSSVKEVMRAMTDNQRGTVVVVDDNFIVQGVVADGDIRRAMLRGAMMITPISKITNINFVSISEEEKKSGRADEIFQKEHSINVLPVVDSENKLVDLAVRDPLKRKTI